MIQDWANDNAGSIELSGNLAAVGQRHLAIQQQARQIATLQNLADIQRRQAIENEQLEERQNVLYDISAALIDIKKLFDREPGRAYFQFLLLDEFVLQLGLEHRMFPSLDWKNHCDKTLSAIAEHRAWCKSSLDQKAKDEGVSAYNNLKQQEAGLAKAKQEKEDEAIQQSLKNRDERVQLEGYAKRLSMLALFSSLVVAFAPLTLANNPRDFRWLAAFGSVVPVWIAVRAIRAMGKYSGAKSVWMAAFALAVTIVSLLAFFFGEW